MTDEPVLVEVPESPAVEEDSEPQVLTEHCRHCGAAHELLEGEDPDWQCAECERYQDAMVCPTCHQLARISLMPSELAPEVHAPSRRRKKE